MQVAPVERLRSFVDERGREGAASWLSDAVDSIQASTASKVRVALARCTRIVGTAALDHDDWPLWTACDAARALLVLRLFEVADDASSRFGALLRRSDQAEQVSLLRMLPLLPEPASLVSHAVEACRTNSEVVFRAIACANPFPAQYFPALNFNQLVLKAIFMGVPVSGVQGLDGRLTDELLRMADDFAAERRAAGRPVPSDVAFLHERVRER